MFLLALAACGAWALLTSHQWDIDDATNVLESAGHVVRPAPPEDVDRLRGLDGYLSTDCVSIEDGTVYCLHTFGDNLQATEAAPALPPSIGGGRPRSGDRADPRSQRRGRRNHHAAGQRLPRERQRLRAVTTKHEGEAMHCADCGSIIPAGREIMSGRGQVCPDCAIREADATAPRSGYGPEATALAAGLLPFVVHLSWQTAVNGVVTYRDYAALVAAPIAVAAAVWLGLTAPAEVKSRRYAIATAVGLLGVVHVLRGLGQL